MVLNKRVFEDNKIMNNPKKESLMSKTTQGSESNEQNKTPPKTTRHTLLKITGALFMILVISDLYYHHNFMQLSCSLTKQLQTCLGNIGFSISWIFSYPLTFALTPFIFLYFLFTDSYKTSIYFYFLFCVQLHIVVVLKAVYGRGRPIIIGDGIIVEHCSCDYGMPSGHSSTSLAGYYLVIVWVSKKYKQQISKGKYNAVFAICMILALMVGISRIYYGAHSFSQISYGFLISALVILFLTEKKINNFLKKINARQVISYGVGLLIFSFFFVLGFYYYSKTRPQDPSWKYWNRCKVCDNTFVNKQLANLSFLFMLPGILIGLGINAKSRIDADYEIPKNSTILGWKRLGLIVLALGLICVVAYGISFLSYLIDKNGVDLKFVQSTIFSSIMMFFCGVLMTAGGPLIYESWNLAVESDYLEGKRVTRVVLETSYEENADLSGVISAGET